MAPIKVGFIGLTSPISGLPNEGTKWAEKAHIDYLRDNGGKYEIVALLNSSKERAESAAKEYKLGDGVKGYGDPEEFAADANIDLVVCAARVDNHYKTTKPSLLAKKDAFIEWPLGADLKQAEELATLAKKQNVKTVLGLQATFSPVVEKVKELVDGGKIGKPLSTTWIGHTGLGGTIYPEALRSFLNKDIGANPLTIAFPHTIEYILYVLGEFKTWDSQVANQRPVVDLISNDGQTVLQKDAKKNTADQVLIQGTTSSNAVLSYHLRENTPFPDTPSLDWRIYGEKGEIRVTSSTIYLNVGSPDTKISYVEQGSTEVKEADVRKDEWESLSLPGRNIARVYEAFADGKKGGFGKAGYRGFEYAVERHKLVDEVEKKWEMQSA